MTFEQAAEYLFAEAVHPVYGKVAAVGRRDGEPWVMYSDGPGVVNLMPAETLTECTHTRSDS